MPCGGKGDSRRERENKQFNDAVRACEGILRRTLDDDERQELHRAVSGQRYGYYEIVDECVHRFAGRKPKPRRNPRPGIRELLWDMLL